MNQLQNGMVLVILYAPFYSGARFLRLHLHLVRVSAGSPEDSSNVLYEGPVCLYPSGGVI